MSYSKRDFGKDLKSQLDLGYVPSKIGNWAHETYLKHCGRIDQSLEEILIDLFFLEEGPEFELTAKELYELADKLVIEGEKEECIKPLSEIKEFAKDLGDNWLMCPLCQEAWQNPHPQYAMTLCPRCNHKLHNPIFKTS